LKLNDQYESVYVIFYSSDIMTIGGMKFIKRRKYKISKGNYK
jgi:hypothetical protein